MVGREHNRSRAGIPPYLRLIVMMALLEAFLLPPPARALDCPEFAFAQPAEDPLAALNCDFHHRYVHANPRWSREVGLMLSRVAP